MLRHITAISAVMLLAVGPAMAGDPPAATHKLVYQCTGEQPQSFLYNSNHRLAIQFPTENQLEAQWYWNRTRADHGQGCQIVSVDGYAFDRDQINYAERP